MGVLCDLCRREQPRLLNCTHKPAVKCWLMMRPETQTDSRATFGLSVLRIIPGHKYHPIPSARTHIHALAHYKVTAHTHTHTHTHCVSSHWFLFYCGEVLWSIRVSGGCHSHCCALTHTLHTHTPSPPPWPQTPSPAS